MYKLLYPDTATVITVSKVLKALMLPSFVGNSDGVHKKVNKWLHFTPLHLNQRKSCCFCSNGLPADVWSFSLSIHSIDPNTENREEDYFGCEVNKLFYVLIAHNEYGKC